MKLYSVTFVLHNKKDSAKSPFLETELVLRAASLARAHDLLLEVLGSDADDVVEINLQAQAPLAHDDSGPEGVLSRHGPIPMRLASSTLREGFAHFRDFFRKMTQRP